MGGRLLIATTNAGKLREVSAMLADYRADVISLNEFSGLPEAIEDGDTFEANARIKALHYARLTNLWTLADDSGLEVDALNGAPGVRSARYAGDDADDAANNARLIAALAGISQDLRTARFRCAMALADRASVVATGGGAIEGLIIIHPRGSNGFGYDPHFLVPEYGMTTAEMPPELKNRVSHRGRALRAILPAVVRCICANDPA
jgi:XTP/dITP diphosphohydrolase